MSESLSDILNVYTVPVLIAMINQHKLVVRELKSKAAYVRLLAEYFGSRAHIQKAYQQLSPVEREVVDILLRQPEPCSVYLIEHNLLALKLIEPVSAHRLYPSSRLPDLQKQVSRNLEDVLARLTMWGLVFGFRQMNPYGQPLAMDFSLAQEYRIPESVRRNLPEPAPQPKWAPKDALPPVKVMDGSARAFQRDLFFYWSFLKTNPVTLTSRGLVPKRVLTDLNDSLQTREVIGTGVGETDFPRLVFIRGLLAELGATLETDRNLITRPTPAFFSQPPLERIKTCFDLYVNGHFINELFWNPGLGLGANSIPPFPAPNSIIDARRAFLLYLKPVHGWLPFAELSEHIQNVAYEFLFKRAYPLSDYEGSYSYGYPSHPYSAYTNPFGWNFSDVSGNADGWEKVEGFFIRQILMKPLFWMGLVNLGFSTAERIEPDMFCLNPLGAWLINGSQPPEIVITGGRVILQPNFQITAFDPIEDETLLNLESFGERISADRAIEFRLTQASVYRGQQQGWDDQRIISYLEELIGFPVPENVARTIREWQTLHDRIKIYPHVSLLYAADANDLDLLCQEPELKELLKERPAPEVVVMSGKTTLPRLVDTLVKNSWVPVIFRSEQKVPAEAISIDEDMRIQLTQPTSNLYLHGYLLRFAEYDGKGGYQLTEASVERATRNGMQPKALLAELRQVMKGELPAGLEKKILAWSGHYGKAELQEVVLFKAENQQILEELLEDEVLGGLLTPITRNQIEHIAVVNPRDLSRLQKLLQERGIKLR